MTSDVQQSWLLVKESLIQHQQIQYWHLVVQTNAEQNLGALDVNTISWEMEAVAEFLEHNEDTNGRTGGGLYCRRDSKVYVKFCCLENGSLMESFVTFFPLLHGEFVTFYTWAGGI